MFLTLGNVLDGAALEKAHARIAGLNWRDGAVTAGTTAKQVKRNEQADLSSGEGKALAADLLEHIMAHPVVKAYARPAKVSPLLISRTGANGGYGAHVDNAIMGRGQNRLRTDLSFTLFLSDPETYKGGELSLDLSSGVQTVKLNAGDMVIYPSGFIHEVTPVTKGERLVAVGWMQSQIRNVANRQTLFDLEQVRTTLRTKSPGSPELLTLDKVISNLLREWAEF